MVQQDVNWATLKDFATGRVAAVQYVETDSEYRIFVIDGSFSVTTTLSKTPSDTTDLNDFENNFKPTSNAPIQTEAPPFGAKKLPNGKSLFRRIHGIRLDLDGTLNNQKVTFTVPYVSAKITSTEIIGAKIGDSVDFAVLDTATGTVTTIPNYTLNQFGFDVYPSEGRYEQKSEYDADLFQGLQLEITVTPVNTDVRSLYFNLVLHEVV